eukprot:6847801-Prymnesium_polylepis.1
MPCSPRPVQGRASGSRASANASCSSCRLLTCSHPSRTSSCGRTRPARASAPSAACQWTVSQTSRLASLCHFEKCWVVRVRLCARFEKL